MKADPEGSTILLRFQNVVDLSKYIIDNYDRSSSSAQYEIQQLLVKNNGIPEEEKRRVESAYKSKYQHAVISDNQNKKRERQAYKNSEGTPLEKRKLSFLSFLKSFENKIEQGPYHICVICNQTLFENSVRKFQK